VPTSDPATLIASNNFHPGLINPKRKRPPAAQVIHLLNTGTNHDSDHPTARDPPSNPSLPGRLIPPQADAFATHNYFASLSAQPTHSDDKLETTDYTTESQDPRDSAINDDMSQDDDAPDCDLEQHKMALSQEAFL
jgi:hypothetical protein